MDIVARAKELAYRAHAGQVDKAGRPYIEHVSRVAASVCDDPEAEAVAWLHDILEDCQGYESDIIGFPASVSKAAHIITRYVDETDAKYYWHVRSNALALRVKLSDIADNSDEYRLALLDKKTAERLRKKYAKAICMLTKNECNIND